MESTTNNSTAITASSSEQEWANLSTEKMALLGKMVAGIIHEINTPAGAINAASVNAVHHVQALLSAFMAMDELSLTGEDLHQIIMFIQKMTVMLNRPQIRRSSAEMRHEQKRLISELEQQGIQDGVELARQLARMELGEHLDEVLELAKRRSLDELLIVLTHCHRIVTSLLDIQISVGMLMHDVRALKSYAHPGQEAPELLDVHDTLDVALTILKNQLKHRIQVQYRYGDIPLIPGYASELSHVWINVLHNAIQAIEDSGVIVIETSTIDGHVGVKITDNGIGIPPEAQPKIFESDFTTKAPGQGTGLGLALANQIITKHGGTITVESQPGQTTFEVHLPLPVHLI
jgi:signal transduction histidine kinase